MAVTRLQLYNRALQICGERKLASLSEDRKPRHELDLVWDSGFIDSVLAEGQWKFAMRAVQIDYDPTITTSFGYQRAFSKPTDWILTSAMCSDEYFRFPLLRYVDEAGYWYADLDTIYLRYVSNDAAYGSDLSLWPAHFTDFAAAHLASKIIFQLTGDEKKEEKVFKLLKHYKGEAKNADAMGDPTKFAAPGSWVSSRARGRSDDRGNNGSLIG